MDRLDPATIIKHLPGSTFWIIPEATMEYPKLGKVRRNIYMGPEYLDLEAIVVNERKRTGRDLSVSDLIRKACAEYANAYWSSITAGTRNPTESGRHSTDV